MKILMLEDNKLDAKLIKEELTEHKFDFISELVKTEKDFITAIHDFKPDIILSDYALPQFTGFEALEIAKKLIPDIPFIIVTGSLSEEMAVDSIKRGAWDYILKENLLRLTPAIENALKLKIEKDKNKLAEQALKESEIRYKELFDNISSGVAVYDVIDDGKDFIFKDFNKAAERLGNDKRDDLIGKSIFEMRPEVEKFGLIDVFRKVWKTGKPAYHPITFYQDEKIHSWYENFVYKLQTKEIVAVFNDITERKQAEEQIKRDLKEKEIMLKEIHHRVKNNLQIMSSLLSLQASKINDERISMILNESKSRIQSMSIVHEMMYQNQDFARIDMKYYINKLIASLTLLYYQNAEQIKIIDKCKNVQIDLNRAIPCGMIINELVSNAIKHAFPDKRKGEIDIRLEEKSGKVHLSVRDDGIALPPGFKSSEVDTLGMAIISDLTEQLDGILKVVQGDGFKEFNVVFPF